jgi:hypothetical protein
LRERSEERHRQQVEAQRAAQEAVLARRRYERWRREEEHALEKIATNLEKDLGF